MYVIGIFLATNEVEVIPEDWLSDPATSIKSSTECWWPPYKSTGKAAKAVITREQVDKVTWSQYSLKVLGRYETFEEARRKLPKATDTSNLESEEEVGHKKRKRQRNRFLVEDDESSEEDCNRETLLPNPPKFKKLPSPKLLNEPHHEVQITEKSIGCSSPTTSKDYCQHQNKSDLNLLRRDVLDIKLKLNKLLEAFDDLKHIILTQGLSSEVLNKPSSEENEVITSITNKFPLSEEDLDTVENLLEDARTKNNLMIYLKKYGGCNVKVATFTLLRLIFSDSTGSKYSWVGAKKKKVFSTLRTFEVISDAIRERFRESTLEEISIHVKTWLRNAPMRILLKQKKTM